ncbi:MAG: response regulator transcription factor [Chloroflexota bacterium]|nr:response regulator transcription factor [Chloroflexota bacterium]
MRSIRVLLADDHPVVRGGIKALLEVAEDIAVVGEASDGAEALRLAREMQPDVLVLDMELPEMSGAEVAERLAGSAHPVRVLALSAYDRENYITETLEAGAAGYLTKDEAPGHIVEAVRGVARGQDGWVSRRVAAKMIQRAKVRSRNQTPAQSALSPREQEVLELLAGGIPNPEIASTLFISEGTVRNHVTSIYNKLGARTRAEAVAKAWQLRAREERDRSNGADRD